MSLRIGIYDFFAYTLSGVFYVLIALFGFVVFGVVEIDYTILTGTSLFSFLIFIFVGYFVGLLLDPIAFKWSLLFQKGNREARIFAFEQFHKQNPRLKIDFEATEWPVMLQAIKYKSIDLAKDIEQHNVASILFRNISLGLLLVAAILLLFFSIVSSNFWNLVLAGISLFFSIIAIRRCRLRRHWFYKGILDAFAAIYLLDEKKMGDIKPDVNDVEPISSTYLDEDGYTMKINLKDRFGELTTHGKRKVAEAMYVKGKNFLGAAMLLRKRGGYEYVVLYLLCQGIEITLKSFLLFSDFDTYWPQLKGVFGHNLGKLTCHVLSLFGLNPLRSPLSKELHDLDQLYQSHNLRYASLHDLFIDPSTISSERVLRRTAAALRLAERYLSEIT